MFSPEEIIAWVQETSRRWRGHLEAHPQILDLPCDIREGAMVRDLIQHIVAVELRYAERLLNLPATDYDRLPKDTVGALYQTHERAMTLLNEALSRPGTDWEETIEFPTRSAGTLKARLKTIVMHLLMHSIRHYAQLGTIARHGGAPQNWLGDYLLMDMMGK